MNTTIGTIIILSIAALFCGFTRADSTVKKKGALVISYFGHPEIDKYNQLVLKAYQDIGINVNFTKLPARRGLLALEQGLVDGDTIRLNKTVSQFENILIVAPPLVIAEIALICAIHKPCDKSILKDKTASIVSNIGNNLAVSDLDIKADIILLENTGNALSMLEEGRTDYLIYGLSSDLRKSLNYQSISLTNVVISHVIHKKHEQLLPELSKALKNRLRILNK